MSDAIHMNPPVLSKGRMWAALGVILFGQFIVSIDLTILNIALPDLTKELRPTSDQLLWIIDVYSLVVAGLLVATSSLSDRFGRKRMLLTGFFIFGFASGLIMIAESAKFVIAIRAMLGVAGAMIMPVTISMIRSIFTDAKERALAIAIWSSISAIGMATGPLIGGVLLDFFSWHAAFFVNVPLMAAAFLIGIFVLPEVKLKNPGKFDVLASILFLAGMVAFLWGVKHLAAELAFDAPGIIATVAGIVLLIAFAIRCATSENPLVDISLFKSRAFSGGVIAMLFSTFAMAILLYLLSQWFQLVNGDSSLEAGLKLIPMAIASLISCLIATAIAVKFRVRSIIAGGMIIAAASLIMLIFFRDNLELAPIMASTILVGLGTGALALGGSLMLCETPAEKASSSGSIQEISYDLGNVLGVAILGSVASIVYRQSLNVRDLKELGFDHETIDAIQQSFSVASEIGNEYGITELIKQGTQAFDDSVVFTCFIGGIFIFITALIVWALIPKDARITEDVDSADKTTDFATNSLESPNTNDELVCTENEKSEDSDPTLINGTSILHNDKPNDFASTQALNTSTHNENCETCDTLDEGTTRFSITLNTDTFIEMKRVCKELGIPCAVVFTMFAAKVAREKRIPFELALTQRTSTKTDQKENNSSSSEIDKEKE